MSLEILDLDKDFERLFNDSSSSADSFLKIMNIIDIVGCITYGIATIGFVLTVYVMGKSKFGFDDINDDDEEEEGQEKLEEEGNLIELHVPNRSIVPQIEEEVVHAHDSMLQGWI